MTVDFTEAEIARSQNNIADLFDAAGLTHDLEAGTEHATEPQPAKFTTAASALRYMIAGNATVTFKSKKTEQRFTFRIRIKKDDEPVGPRGRIYFVSLLVGQDNTADYQYLGHFWDTQMVYWHGRKSRIGADAPSAKAFDWVWRNLQKGVLPEQVEIFHTGTCGRCGRMLTVPESITSGFGPECINKI